MLDELLGFFLLGGELGGEGGSPAEPGTPNDWRRRRRRRAVAALARRR